jgi:hypothetical protein
MERGVAAVDGTQIAVDQLIKEAVSAMMKQNDPVIPTPEGTSDFQILIPNLY